MSHTTQPFRLILASDSPRRRELLTQAGYVFDIEAADVDETPHANESPAAYVQRLAEEKARAILARHPHSSTPLVVLGADTTVVCDNEILAKPDDGAHAIEMLRKLSGRTHEVLTGIAAATHARTISAVERTQVAFAEIPAAELDRYCATHEPLDKAGAYGIQGYAARWIPRIDGDYFNVMGLPIARVVKLLAEALGEMADAS
ncbi:MAG TPA: nucleoside triphosphate pyrophosphatase [Acidobacteriaceae bacterium]|nr:nucleoside triphosphate pyrophosphatase [Acidobacteriaceae bacterium]